MRSVEDVMKRIKQQAKKNALGAAALEQFIRDAREAGKTLRDIAAAAEMTPEGVRKLINRTSSGKADEPSAAPPDPVD